MTYVAPDGSITESQPWNVSRINRTMWSVAEFFIQFFSTLTEPLFTSLSGNGNSNPSRSNSSLGGFRGWASGSGSGSAPRGGSGGFGPNRRIGRIRTMADVQVPGGCSGGSCGM